MTLLEALKQIAKKNPVIIEWRANEEHYVALSELAQQTQPVRDGQIEAYFPSPQKVLWAIMLKQVVENFHATGIRISEDYEAFAKEYQAEPSFERRMALSLDYYRQIRGPKANLRKAKKAFNKYLELENFLEDYRLRMERLQIMAEKAFDSIGHLLCECLEENFPKPKDRERPIQFLMADYGFEPLIMNYTLNSPRPLTRIGGARMFSRIASVLPAESKLMALENLQAMLRIGQNPTENVQLQIEALNFIARLYKDKALGLFRIRLLNPARQADDNLFVRKWMVDTLGTRFCNAEGLELLRDFLLEQEPSDFVRVAAVRALGYFSFEKAAPILKALCLLGVRRDISAPVRAACIQGLVQSALADPAPNALEDCAKILGTFLAEESGMFSLRICMENLTRLVLEGGAGAGTENRTRKILDAIGGLIQNNKTSIKVRYWAAIYKEQILAFVHPEFKKAIANVSQALNGMVSGDRRPVPRHLVQIDPDLLGRTMAYLSLQDFGLYLKLHKGRLVFEKGERFRFQIWRLLHEMSNPSPDKRRNFGHTKGRHFEGTIRAPSDLLGELTMTKVPGEPLVIWDEGSWRRHIPLVDDCLSLLRPFKWEHQVRIYSSSGVTVMTGPKEQKERLRNYLRLTNNYAHVADLRNSHPGNKEFPDLLKYFDELAIRYGIDVSFTPYDDVVFDKPFAPVDPEHKRIFGSD